jgi:biotin carboxyl carrier protein
MAHPDWSTVRHILELARSRGYAEVSLRQGDFEFSASLEAAPKKKKVSSALTTESGEPVEPPLLEVTAPLVGFYRPGKATLEPGTTLSKGDLVGEIVALGLATDVESTVSGEVVEVLIEADQPVQYGQVLARVRG